MVDVWLDVISRYETYFQLLSAVFFALIAEELSKLCKLMDLNLQNFVTTLWVSKKQSSATFTNRVMYIFNIQVEHISLWNESIESDKYFYTYLVTTYTRCTNFTGIRKVVLYYF